MLKLVQLFVYSENFNFYIAKKKEGLYRNNVKNLIACFVSLEKCENFSYFLDISHPQKVETHTQFS